MLPIFIKFLLGEENHILVMGLYYSICFIMTFAQWQIFIPKKQEVNTCPVLRMSRIKGKQTKPEMLVRRFLHAHGYRYKLHDIASAHSISSNSNGISPKIIWTIIIHQQDFMKPV